MPVEPAGSFFIKKKIQLARRIISRYSSEFAKYLFNMFLSCLEVLKDTIDRDLRDELIEISSVCRALGPAKLPMTSTLRGPFNRLEVDIWRIL